MSHEPLDIRNKIEEFATQICKKPFLGLVFHVPEIWARPNLCYLNVMEKVNKSGGKEVYGWTFNFRKSNVGHYLFATHHCIWGSPDGNPIDITPFNEEPKHHPITQDGSVLFLIDDTAMPLIKGDVIAPLPLRFFAIEDNQEIKEYVAKLNSDESDKYKMLGF